MNKGKNKELSDQLWNYQLKFNLNLLQQYEPGKSDSMSVCLCFLISNWRQYTHENIFKR